MSAPDPTDPTSHTGQVLPHSHRRFWRWGIWFWIVLWIVSILVEVGLQVRPEDGPDVMLSAGYGSLVVVLTDQDVYQLSCITWEKPSFIWSERNQRLHSEHSEFMFARLGGFIWKTSGERQTMALPISGFLWLWLIGGWAARLRNNQRPDFRSKRNMAQAAALIFLPLVILQANRAMSKVLAESEVSGCMMNMRNIQCAVRSYWGMKDLYSGKPIPWDEIFGPGKFVPTFLRKCPSGQDYILDTHIPAEYRLVVKCPNPGHQQRVKKIDTSGW